VRADYLRRAIDVVRGGADGVITEERRIGRGVAEDAALAMHGGAVAGDLRLVGDDAIADIGCADSATPPDVVAAEAADVLDEVLVRDGHGEINASGVLSVDVRPDLVALDPELRHRWRSRREAIVRTKLVDDAGQGAVVFQQRDIAELAGGALWSAHVEPGAI